MEADWEVEIGGGAPVIEAFWPGFVDLRQSPSRVKELSEAVAFPALAEFLVHVNGPDSPLWTSKCDVWQPDEGQETDIDSVGRGTVECDVETSALACYVDLLPRQSSVFAQWEDAAKLCRAWVERMESVDLPRHRVELIVRQAVAGEADGFGITAYVSVLEHPDEAKDERSPGREGLSNRLAAAMQILAQSIPAEAFPEAGA